MPILTIKLSKIIKYAHDAIDQKSLVEAMAEFFTDFDIEAVDHQTREQVMALFHEWLIYDFKTTSDLSFVRDYYLKNPDNLGKKALDELKQIIDTQYYDFFEIGEIKQGEWLQLQGVFFGKSHKVYDHLGSMSITDKGVLPARVAKINKKWQMMGANTFILPVVFSERMKKMMKNGAKNGSKIDCRQALPFFSRGTAPNPKMEILTPKQIKNQRKSLARKYQKLAKKYNCNIEFEKITDLLIKKDQGTDVVNWLEEIGKLGVFQEMLLHSDILFQEIWNFFPHKGLDGLSPREMINEELGE